MCMKTVGILQVGETSENSVNSVIKHLKSVGYAVKTVFPKSESLKIDLELSIQAHDILIVITGAYGCVFKALSELTSQELRENPDIVQSFKQFNESYSKEECLLPLHARIINQQNVFPLVHFQRIFIVKAQHTQEIYDKILKNRMENYRKLYCFQKTVHWHQNGKSGLDPLQITKIPHAGVSIDLTNKNDHYTYKISSFQFGDISKFLKQLTAIDVEICDESDYLHVYMNHDQHIKNSIKTIEHSLEQFGVENTFLCFNGGKDCTVLLHLVLAVIKRKFPNYNQPLFCLYVQSDKPFPEQEEFIEYTKVYYNLKIMTIRSGIKRALEETLRLCPNYKACFMGTRRTDPFSTDLKTFQMTDSSWPQIMRVSPLLDWHYCDIWDYLLYYKVPYCKLYDKGYTSLGNTENTKRNPSLVYYDAEDQKEKYLPAYKLFQEINERNGRS